MGILRRGVIALAVMAGIGLAMSAVAVADGIRTAGPRYADGPPIWRGLYGGIHLGHADADFDDFFVGGVQLGYNWQVNQIVYGLEGDISLSGADSIDYLASFRGRLGYLIQPSLMVYATAGLGLVDGGDSDAGFVYGLGIEGMISDTMSARLEYLAFNNDSGNGDDSVGVIRAGLNIKLGR
jgi:outer membrane immunogenic protein